MGRWAESEFDRILLQKVRSLFDSCRDPLVESSNVDLRFRTFVKNLDINDKAIQACFRSLIQQSHLSNARARRHRPLSEYLRDIEAPPDPLNLTDGPSGAQRGIRSPPRPSTRVLRREANNRALVDPPPDGPYQPTPEWAAWTRRQNMVERMMPTSVVRDRLSDMIPLLPIASGAPPPAGGSTASRANSPSRMRRLGLDPSATSFVPRGQAPPSPPSAASRLWLDEYAPDGNGEGEDEEEEAELAFEAQLPMVYPYHPSAVTYPGERSRRRRREIEAQEEDAEEEQAFVERMRRRRNRLNRLAAPRQLGVERDPVDPVMENDEVEAMFGSWMDGMAAYEDGEDDTDDDDDHDDYSTYPRIFEPTTNGPQPIPDHMGPEPTRRGGEGGGGGMIRLNSIIRRGGGAQAPVLRQYPNDWRDRDTRRDGLVIDVDEVEIDPGVNNVRDRWAEPINPFSINWSSVEPAGEGNDGESGTDQLADEAVQPFLPEI